MAVVPGTGIITPALTLLGVTTQGETPATGETADGLRLLNAMWANWNADDLTMGSVNSVTGTWNSGIATDFLGVASVAWPAYTGPGPSRLRAAYVVVSGRDIPLKIETRSWYQALAFPTLQASSPEYMVYTPPFDAAAGGQVNVWPVPNANVTINVTYLTPFPVLADATTAVTLNQMALMPSIYNLAVAIASAYGVNVPPSVAKEAGESLARLRNYAASTWNMDPNPPGGQTLTPPAPPTP